MGTVKFTIFIMCIMLKATSFARMTYQVIIPKSKDFPVAKLLGTIDRPLEEFTLCHWTRCTKESNYYGAILSYSSETGPVMRSQFRFDGYYYFLPSSQPGYKIFERKTIPWYHICVSASGFMQGNGIVYVNGKEIQPVLMTTIKYPIPQNGYVVLGQWATVKDTTFHVDYKYQGQIADVFMWDRILTPQEIAAVANCVNTEDANVINWNLHTWRLYNGVRISSVKLPCGKN